MTHTYKRRKLSALTHLPFDRCEIFFFFGQKERGRKRRREGEMDRYSLFPTEITPVVLKRGKRQAGKRPAKRKADRSPQDCLGPTPREVVQRWVARNSSPPS
uniref:Uncharacterized protein n=1 Tax=Sphaerodactylus townsendi TaxID=933632 RepID=A0ACB8FAM3_9SAUR